MTHACDIDELLVALSEVRVARDRVARQLPDGFVQDTPEKMLMVQRLNSAFVHLSRAALDMRLALDPFLDAQIFIDITPGCRR